MDILEQVWQVANDLADDWNADFLYINSDIDEEAFDYVFHETEPRRSKGKYLFIVLNTEAGSAASALKIMEYFRFKYHGTCIVVLGRCKEVATVMCRQALETWVGRSSRLGPLDLRNISKYIAREPTEGSVCRGSIETFRRLNGESDFIALHTAINAPEASDFVTFREGGVSVFSRAIDIEAKSNGKLSTIVDMLPKKAKKYDSGQERHIFYLNGEYGW